MAFEEERIRELEQHEENERIQQELDLAIARIENDQIHRALDKAIEGLDQEISDQDENMEEEVAEDQLSQQSTSIKEEVISDKSITEEIYDQQDSLDQSMHTWNEELTSHQDEDKEEQVILDQASQQSFSTEEELISHDSATSEYSEKEVTEQHHILTIEHQDQASQTPTTEEEVYSLNTIIEEDSELLDSTETSHQGSGNQSELCLQENKEEQTTNNQDLKKTSSLLQEKKEQLDQGFTKDAENLEISTQNNLQDQKGESNQLYKPEENHLSQHGSDVIIKQRNQISQQSFTPSEEYTLGEMINIEKTSIQLEHDVSNQLSLQEILFKIKDSGRYSLPVLNYIDDILNNDHSIKLYSHSQIEFWKTSTEKMRAAVKRSYKKGNVLHTYRREISELASWTKNMEIMAKSVSKEKDKTLENGDVSIIQTFTDFIEGDASYLSKLLNHGELSIKFQKTISKNVLAKLSQIKIIDDINTRINKIEHCYESIISLNNKLIIIRSSQSSNVNLHISRIVELLKEEKSFIKDIDNENVEISDVLLTLDDKIFDKIMNHIRNSKDIYLIHLHKDVGLGNVVSKELSEYYSEKITKEVKAQGSNSVKTIKQRITEIFAQERTFDLTQTHGWFKPAISWREKLTMFIKIEKALSAGSQIRNVRGIIKTSFQEWESLKHSKNDSKIGGVPTNKWIETLEDISTDELGYNLTFNFSSLKGLKKLRQKKAIFLDRFNSKMAGEKRYIPDKWEGVIYDTLGQLKKRDNVTNIFTLRIRKNIAVYEELLEKTILKRLEKIAARDLRNLSKLFESQNFLKEIWVSAGHKTPDEILISLMRETNNPLHILKEVEVNFNVVDGIKVLASLFDEVQFDQDLNVENFQEIFTNRHIIDKALNSEKIMTAKILKGKAFNYLSHETLEQVPIPRFSKSKGIMFADITNENEKAAAIRVFLDLIVNNKEGRELLCNLGLISKETQRGLSSKRENVEFIINWETGIKTQKIEGLTTGLLDGIVTTKSSDTYLDEFIVEMVGTNKGNLLQDSMKNPLSNVIGDILRIACYGVLEKPGIITYAHYDNCGNLNYTIISFDKRVGIVLREAGVFLAVDINRPRVRRLYQKSQKQLKSQFEKVFKIKPNLDPTADLQKLAIDGTERANIYSQFLELIRIILVKEG